MPITIIFISFSILSTTLRLAILWINNYFAALIGNDISCLAYKKTLNQSMKNILILNSSQSSLLQNEILQYSIYDFKSFILFIIYYFYNNQYYLLIGIDNIFIIII